MLDINNIDNHLRSVLCVGLVGGKTDAKPVLYEGGISRTTLSSKHVKRKRKNERGKQMCHLTSNLIIKKCKRTFYYLT